MHFSIIILTRRVALIPIPLILAPSELENSCNISMPLLSHKVRSAFLPDHRRSLFARTHTHLGPRSLQSDSSPYHHFHISELLAEHNPVQLSSSTTATLKVSVPLPAIATVVVLVVVIAIGIAAFLYYHYIYMRRKHAKKVDLAPRPFLLKNSSNNTLISTTNLGASTVNPSFTARPVSRDIIRAMLSSSLQNSLTVTGSRTLVLAENANAAASATTLNSPLLSNSWPATPELQSGEGQYQWDFYCKGDRSETKLSEVETQAKDGNEVKESLLSYEKEQMTEKFHSAESFSSQKKPDKFGNTRGQPPFLSINVEKANQCKGSLLPSISSALESKIYSDQQTPYYNKIESGLLSHIPKRSVNDFPNLKSLSENEKTGINIHARNEMSDVTNVAQKSPKYFTGQEDSGKFLDSKEVPQSENYGTGANRAWLTAVAEELSLIPYDSFDKSLSSLPKGKRVEAGLLSTSNGDDTFGGPLIISAHETSELVHKIKDSLSISSTRSFSRISSGDDVDNVGANNKPTGTPPAFLTTSKSTINPKHRDLTPAKSCLKTSPSNTPEMRPSKTLPTLVPRPKTSRLGYSQIPRKPSFTNMSTSTPLRFPLPPVNSRLPKSVTGATSKPLGKASGPAAVSFVADNATISFINTPSSTRAVADDYSKAYDVSPGTFEASLENPSSQISYLSQEQENNLSPSNVSNTFPDARFYIRDVMTSKLPSITDAKQFDSANGSVPSLTKSKHGPQLKSLLPVLKQSNLSSVQVAASIESPTLGTSPRKRSNSLAVLSQTRSIDSSKQFHTKAASISSARESPTRAISIRFSNLRNTSTSPSESSSSLSHSFKLKKNNNILSQDAFADIFRVKSFKTSERQALDSITNTYRHNHSDNSTSKISFKTKLPRSRGPSPLANLGEQNSPASLEDDNGILSGFSLAEDNPDPFANYSPPPWTTTKMNAEQDKNINKWKAKDGQIVIKVKTKGVDTEEMLAIKVPENVGLKAFTARTAEKLGYDVEFFAPIDDGSHIGLTTQYDFKAWLARRIKKGVNTSLDAWPKALL